MTGSTPLKDMHIDFMPYINYESIVCVPFVGSPEKINAACMGVHFTTTNEVFLHVYENTHTRSLLLPGTRFSINFSENFEEYVIAGLKQFGPEEEEDELPRDSFTTQFSVPILKSCWSAVICEVLEMPETLIEKPPCRRPQIPNVRAKIIENHVFNLPYLFNNRSTNLALEALIVVTRLPFVEYMTDTYVQKLKTYRSIKSKITYWRDMDRFETAFQRMDNFLVKNGVKLQEIFDV